MRWIAGGMPAWLASSVKEAAAHEQGVTIGADSQAACQLGSQAA